MTGDDVTLILVEDHLALRKGLELLLRARGFHVVGVAAGEEEALRLLKARRPDVALVDLGLEGTSGVALVKRVLDHDPAAGVLIYTGSSDPQELDAAARCGARGFALKSIDSADLVAAIRAVAAGGIWIDPALAGALAPPTAQAAMLTPREREILELLASGVTGEQAAGRLCLSPETVRTHVRNAMRKLDANTRVHAIALAVQQHEIAL